MLYYLSSDYLERGGATVKNCFMCKAEIGDNEYCSNCGKLQSCLHCHQPFEKKGKFCHKCGTAKGETASQVGQDTEKVREAQINQMVNQTEKVPCKPLNKKNILSVIGIILGIIAIYFLFFNNNQSKPEDTISNFFQAFNNGDYGKMEMFVDPRDPAYVMGEIDFDDIPRDTQMRVVSFVDKNYYSKNQVIIVVEIQATSKTYDLENVSEVEVELIQLKNKWYIEDIY